MKKQVLLLVALSLFVASPVLAKAYKNGNLLLKECDQIDTNVGSVLVTRCLEYVNGVMDAHETYKQIGLTKYLYCHPDDVTIGQFVDIIRKYLRENPKVRHYDASKLVLDALKEAFPCK